MLFFLGYDNMEDKIEREEETKIILAFTPSATPQVPHLSVLILNPRILISNAGGTYRYMDRSLPGGTVDLAPYRLLLLETGR